MLSPFSLSNQDAYEHWRAQKLANFPSHVEDVVVNIRDLGCLSQVEKEAVSVCIKRAGLAIYKGPVQANKADVQALAGQFGLRNLDKNPYADDDAITPVQVSTQAGRKLYIPYTNKAINWHTDGYYNGPDRTIRAMILHCVRPAGGGGGENRLFDPEIAYILLRDHDPKMIEALQHHKALTIPGNDMDDGVDRADIWGPVFCVDEATQTLHMRYTQRKRHVIWAADAITQQAVAFLHKTLGGSYTLKYRLKAGEGLICNNILHTRAAFENGENEAQKRLILRARFCDRLVL